MELALNLVWLAVVIAAAVTFAFWRDGQAAARQRAVAICAVCILALLFPIVSVTDDLHNDATGAEETSAMRRAGFAALAHVVALAVVSTAVRVIAPQQVARVAERRQPVETLTGFVSALLFRGPPSVRR